MQEHEYRARDKTVKKMSRDGLKEENLHSRKSIRVSNRETDDFFCATQAEDMEDFSKRGERAEDTKSAKKKLYSEKAGRTEAAETVGQDMEESGKKRAASRKMRIPESESCLIILPVWKVSGGIRPGRGNMQKLLHGQAIAEKNSRCSPMSEEKGQKKRQKKNRRLRKKKNLPVFVRTRKQRSSRWKGSVRKSRER